MPPADINSGGMELDDFVRAYEAAWASVERADLRAFLPGPDHPLYVSVMREVVRVDLQFRWDRGQPRPLEDYRSWFPELFSDRESLHAITFEDYRLRRQLGENVTPAEYERRFGVDVTTWPGLHQAAVGSDPAGAARSPECPRDGCRTWVRPAVGGGTDRSDLASGPARPDDAAGCPCSKVREDSPDHSGVFDEPHRSERAIAGAHDQAMTAMPRVGSEFLGFRLLAELGSGTFGRVYLALQGRLADRLVVLKIAPHLFDESRTLAQLQHTHIMPIYSVHQADAFQAVCMPFLGTTTLADLLTDLRQRPALPDSGKYLLDQIKARARLRVGATGFSRVDPGLPGPAEARHPLESLNYVDGILWLATRLADGLAHAHGRGIVHRDVKPANVLLTDDGVPMLLDFNLSEDTKLDRSASAARTGGTLRYMAPEQLAASQTESGHGDERTDVYSFGVILHELLTGRHPFAL